MIIMAPDDAEESGMKSKVRGIAGGGDEHPPISVMSPHKFVRQVPLLPHQHLTEITQMEDVFVLAHLGIPRAKAEDWWLEIAGLVETPRRWPFAELAALPKRTLTAFHQCAGFPRAPHIPTRRLANVVWGGVELSTLLDAAGPSTQATHLWAYGVDGGTFEDSDTPRYVKDLPLTRIPAGDILVAYEMNGEPLDCEHGYPLRLIIPGYYGTNSVKWLYRLELASSRHDGLFTKKLYNDPVPPSLGNPKGGTRPVWEIAPESFVVHPAPDATLTTEAMEIWGWAWGDSEIERVEVSVDGGKSWREAQLRPRIERAWQKFTFEWKPEQTGSLAIASRAIDRNGVVQAPAEARNAVYSVTVTVVPDKA